MDVMPLFGMGFIIFNLVLVVIIIVMLIRTWQTKIQSGREKSVSNAG